MLSSAKTRTLAAVVAVGAALGGCSDIYYDRRESVSLGASDALQGNKVVHMVDPWPAHSGERDIAFNGQRTQAAFDRYKIHRVIPPVNVTTSSVGYAKAQGDAAGAAAVVGAGAVPAAAAVKGP